MTFFDNQADRLVFLVCAALIFIPLERLIPRVRQNGWLRGNLVLDLWYMFVGAALTALLSIGFVFVVVSGLSPIFPQAFPRLSAPNPSGCNAFC